MCVVTFINAIGIWHQLFVFIIVSSLSLFFFLLFWSAHARTRRHSALMMTHPYNQFEWTKRVFMLKRSKMKYTKKNNNEMILMKTATDTAASSTPKQSLQNDFE